MLKKISRFLIVAVIQLTVLVLVSFFLVPYLLDSTKGIESMAKTLENTRTLSLTLRGLVYIAIYYAWPHITKKLIKTPSTELSNQANRARFILIGALLLIEILYWIGQL